MKFKLSLRYFLCCVMLATVSLFGYRSCSKRSLVESLQNPVRVATWSQQGLVLINGETVPIPGIKNLPKHSEAIAEAINRGIQVTSDGDVYALIQIDHWCGNDEVDHHIAKINLKYLCVFLRIGQPDVIVSDIPINSTKGGTFSDRGWEVGEYLEFQAWLKAQSRT